MTTWVNATTTTITKYYHFNGQRIAMRQNGILTYLPGDPVHAAPGGQRRVPLLGAPFR